MILVIWGIAILSTAQIAQAKEIKPSHFSMFELTEKISKIILDKYPNSRIDTSAYTINACNVESPNEPSQSCVSSDTQPRSNSAEFTLRLSVGVDLNPIQRMLFTPKPRIVLKSTPEKRYDFKVIPKPVSKEYPEVPSDSWTYLAYDELVRAGVAEPLSRTFTISILPVTRYQVAVAIARLLDKQTEHAKDSAEVKQLIGDLAEEFAPEIAYLSMPVKPSDVPMAGNGSWPYDAIEQLDSLGVKADIPWSQMGTSKPITRFEFAIATVRLLDKKSERTKDSPEVKKLIEELATEFAPEIANLSVRYDSLKNLPQDTFILQPRYEFLLLDFQYGSKFNKKLRKQIESTIADYTAPWIKSNSSTIAAQH